MSIRSCYNDFGGNPITEVDQLPGADSLPDGFVDSTSENPSVPETPKDDEEKPEFTDYKEEKLVEPDTRPELVIDDNLHSGKSPTVVSESKGCKLQKEIMASEILVHNKGSESQVVDVKETTSKSNSVNTNKVGASEVKGKNAKRTYISEVEFLELSLKYQQVLAEKDSATTVRDKLESLCRELQRQNKVLMDECKRVSTEGQNLRSEFSSKFEGAIKEVSNKLKEQKDECLSQLQENEMLKIKLNELTEQYALSEQQFAQKLKQKTLELQLADLKLKQHEEKLIQEQSQMKLYAEQVSELLTTETKLRSQLTADAEKFQLFQEALVKSNEVFETFKQEIEKMTKSMKELRKENAFLKSKSEKSDLSLIELVEEREHLKKQLERTRNQKERLEVLCRSLRAENKVNSA